MSEGMVEASLLWKASHVVDVDAAHVRNNAAKRALFTSLFPNEQDQPAAAIRVLHRQQVFRSSTQGYAGADLRASCRMWLEDEQNHAAYTKEALAMEIRSAEACLHLCGSTTIPDASRSVAKKEEGGSHSCGTIAYVEEFNSLISSPGLFFSACNSTCKRGTLSCYPAAFAYPPTEHCAIIVEIDAAPRGSNWLTFGLVRKGFPNSSSDGVGRSPNSWGIACDRGSNGGSTALVCTFIFVMCACLACVRMLYFCVCMCLLV